MRRMDGVDPTGPALAGAARRYFIRPRFSLWAMLVLVTVVAIPLSYVAHRRSWNLRRKAAMEALIQRGLLLTDAKSNFAAPLDSPAPKGGRWASLLEEGLTPSVKGALAHGVRSKVGAVDMSPDVGDLSDEELLQLAYFPELEELEIFQSDRITDAGLRVVQSLPNLKRLSLTKCPKVKGTFLGGAPQLESLFLDVDIDRSAAAALQGQTKLKHFSLCNAPLIDDDLAFLANCKNLEVLGLRGISAEGSFLGKFPDDAKLKGLVFAVAPLTDTNAEEFKRFQNLIQLDLGGTTITGEFLAGATWPNLDTLLLQGCRFSEEGKAHLAALRGLNKIAYPSSWRPVDLKRYAGGGAPAIMAIHFSHGAEAASQGIEVTSIYGPVDLLFATNRCPAKAMTEVNRMQEWERSEAIKHGFIRRKR